jgi:hypothetical protein
MYIAFRPLLRCVFFPSQVTKESLSLPTRLYNLQSVMVGVDGDSRVLESACNRCATAIFNVFQSRYRKYIDVILRRNGIRRQGDCRFFRGPCGTVGRVERIKATALIRWWGFSRSARGSGYRCMTIGLFTLCRSERDNNCSIVSST